MSAPAPDSVAANRRFYLPFFAGRSLACDAGCGDGVFLRLLREKGIAAEGIEPREELARACRDAGFTCHTGTAAAVLGPMPGRFDALMLSHVIEHVGPDGAREIVEAARTALKPGGILVIATPNPADDDVLRRDFWDDPTHVRPYTLAALDELVRESGFSVRSAGVHPRTALDDLSPLKKRASGVRLAVARAFGGPPRCLGDLYLVAGKPA